MAIASLALVEVPGAVYERMVEHARAESPNECCGMIAAVDGRASEYFPARNEFESPTRFQLDSADQIRITNEIDARGEEIGAIFHSHPRSDARPSLTDVNLARWWPGVRWLICSLAGAEPVLRCFEIAEGRVEEVELVVD